VDLARAVYRPAALIGLVTIVASGAGVAVSGDWQAKLMFEQQPMKMAAAEGLCETDRKSTRLNSSHVKISYAVFCLKKKMNQETSIEQIQGFFGTGLHIYVHNLVSAEVDDRISNVLLL